MKKIIPIIVIIFILMIIVTNSREKVQNIMKIEHNPYNYYVLDFKGKVDLNNFKNIMDKIDDKKIERVYYDKKIYEYSNYENFIKHLSENSSVEENSKYLIEGVKIDKILIYTTSSNYNKLYDVVLNL